MSYDERGNWDYEAAAIQARLRASDHDRLAHVGLYAGGVLLGLFLAALLLAVAIGGNYVRGRAVGAGVRDALEDR